MEEEEEVGVEAAAAAERGTEPPQDKESTGCESKTNSRARLAKLSRWWGVMGGSE